MSNVGVPIMDVSGKGGARVLKIAVRQRAMEGRGAVDNVLSATAATAVGPPGLTKLDFGQTVAAANSLNGYLQRVVIYGDLTDAQLQAVTS